MKRKVVILTAVAVVMLLVSLSALSGCSSEVIIKELPPPDTLVDIANNAERDASGIIPAAVTVRGVDAGLGFTTTILIKHGGDEPKTYLVYYRPPDNPTNGFDRPRPEFAEWVTVTPSVIEAPPHSFTPVEVTLSIPRDAKALPRQWEYWIGTRVESSAMVQAEMNTRYLIIARGFDWTPVWIAIVALLVLALITVVIFEKKHKKAQPESVSNDIEGIAT